MTSQTRRWGGLAACVLIAFVIRFVPTPEGVTDQAWQTFSVFVAVIVSFIVRPFPMGPMVIFGLVTLVMTKAATLDEALSGYGDHTVWLVVAAFLFANAVVGAGLGQRIALTFVRWWGKSILGLGYAICGAELTLGPIIPSNTARGGGVLAPIVRSLAEALGSRPDDQPERAGQFLIQTGAHANLIAAAMFLTGMAANPLVAKAASDVFGIEFTWGMWALGAALPGLVSFALLPLLMVRLTRPTITETRAAQRAARGQLIEMGPWTAREKGIAAVFVLMIALWASKPLHGLGTTIVAWLGVSLILLTQIENWESVVENKAAWDALIWLGGLLTLANMLRDYGLVDWFAGQASQWVGGYNGMIVVGALAVIYFYSMYGFSMLTGHISAMVAAFFAVAVAADAPPLVTVAVLAYFSNLCGCVTNYSTGPFIIYFGLGYTPVQQWFRNGFVVSLFHLVVWFSVGMVWWKILGWL